jgi:outer membrane receptor protein involved in Fe transport
MTRHRPWLVLASLALVVGAWWAPAGAQDLALSARKPRFIEAWGRPGRPVDVSRAAVLWRRVSLDLTGVPVDTALRVIARDAGLELAYTQGVVPGDRRVSLHAQGITVASALTEVLLGMPVDVAVGRTGQLAIVRATEPLVAPEPVQTGTVVGRVTDGKSRAALAGATVVLDGTRHGATTGNDGRYRIAEVAPGTYTVRARYIGYTPGSASATVSADQEAAADFALEKSAQRLNEVVTTGTVVPTEVKALPTPVSVITSEDIERQHLRRSDQILRQLVPGALSWDTGPTASQTTISVRGATNFNGDGGVKIYVDGVEYSDFAFTLPDPNSIDRIEVIRGPEAAAIYGSGALGGVIQVFTKRGDPTLRRPQVEAKAALGAIQGPSDGSTSLRQDYSLAVRGGTQSASYHFGGGYTHAGDWTPDYYLSNPSVFGNLHVEQGPLSLDLTGRYYQQNWSNSFNPVLMQAGWAYFGKPLYQDESIITQTYGAHLAYAPTSWWRHTVTVGMDQYSGDTHGNQPRLTTPADTLLLVQIGGSRKVSLGYNTSIDGALTRGISGVVTVGFDHFQFNSSGTDANATNTIGTIATSPDSPPSFYVDRITNTGYFGQVQLNLRETVFLTGGLRAEQNSNFGEDLGTPLSPRAGVSIVRSVGSATVKLRGSYGEAIRPPSSGQKTASFGPAGNTLANPQLAPERQVGGDGGVDLIFGPYGSLGITYYHQTARDLIQTVLVDGGVFPPLYQNQNVAKVRNAGWEFEGTLRLRGIDLTGQFAITNSTVEDLGPNYTGTLKLGDQIAYVPRHTAGATLTVTAIPRTTISGGLAYVGLRTGLDWLALGRCFGGTGPCGDFSFQTVYPSFVKGNVSVGREFSRNVSAYVAVENVTNNDASEAFGSLLQQPGRMSMLGIRVVY